MATNPNALPNLEGPDGLFFLPADDHGSTLFNVVDLRPTRELPYIDFSPKTDNPEREFADHYSTISLCRGYAIDLSPYQQMQLLEQLQEAKMAFEYGDELREATLVREQGAVAVASMVEV